jgi:hypothetical protein
VTDSEVDSYTCSYRQLFNTFGAPGIPNTYRAVLSRNGNVVIQREFHWRRRAENQCERWVRLYGARMVCDE